MPYGLDKLKGAWDWANTPLVTGGQEFTQELGQPGLGDSPGWAQAKGFGAGALEGLRGFTSPLQLAGMAMGGGSMMRGAQGAARGLVGAGPVTAKSIAAAKAARNAELMAYGAPMAKATEQALAKTARSGFRVVPPASPQTPVAALGELSSEFTPVGGEAAYNALRPVTKQPGITQDDIYRMMMEKR